MLTGADADAAAKVLSNPLDATVAAELLSFGKPPDLLDLREQQYQAMAREYRDECGMEFPLAKVAEAAYAMRVAGKEEFATEGFETEVKYMGDHRMLTRKRLEQVTDGKQKQWWVFRHDKFLEFFVVNAFRGDHRARRMQHLGDPPFRGVYLRLALVLSLRDAEDLREQFIQYAARSGDHSTSDDYLRILEEWKKRMG